MIFFTTKFSNFVSNMNDDCSQLSFEVHNVFVAQKLPISKSLIDFFFVWTLPLRRPPEAAISSSATSIRYQILAEYVSFHIRYCLLVWHENEEGLDYILQNVLPQPLPLISNWPKSPQVLGLKGWHHLFGN